MQVLNKKVSFIVVVLSVTMLLFAGCGGGSSSSVPVPSPTTTGKLRIDNSGSQYTINRLYVSPSSSSTWGSKRNSSNIAAYSSWTLPGLAPDTYDARGASDGVVSTYYTYASGFPITANTTYTLTTSDSAYTGTFFIENFNDPTIVGTGTPSVAAITQLYISTTGYTGSGTNLLGTSTIAPGATLELLNIPSGVYYIRAYDANGYYVDVNVSSPTQTVNLPSHGYNTVWFYFTS